MVAKQETSLAEALRDAARTTNALLMFKRDLVNNLTFQQIKTRLENLTQEQREQAEIEVSGVADGACNYYYQMVINYCENNHSGIASFPPTETLNQG